MSKPDWYLVINGQQHGPVAFETLQSMVSAGQLQQQDLVWQEGMSNWQSAGSIGGLVPPPRPGDAPPYPPGSQVPLGYYSPPHPYVHYAGFWIRFVAAFIDGLILVVVSTLYESGIRAALGLDPTPLFHDEGPAGRELGSDLIVLMLDLVIGWLYYALQESSVHQATVGKRAVGVQVTDLNLQRISFGRATGRYFAEILSALTLMIGYMLAGWTERKQALHDMIAGTYVIYRDPRSYE